MLFAKIEGGQIAAYPVTKTDAILDNPGISFPKGDISEATMASLGYVPVIGTEPPAALPGHRVQRATPTLNAGVWAEVWEQVPLTAEEQAQALASLKDQIVQATQERLDAFARTRGYDDIKSATDYAGCSVPKFNAEGTYCRDVRAETWAALYTLLSEVQAGTRPAPSGFADIEPLLPALNWPA